MNIKSIKLIKGMTREDVNAKIQDYMILINDVYEGNNSPHQWMCKCGNIIHNRRWSDIRSRNDIECNECVGRRKYKNIVEHSGEYEYIKAFKKGELLPNGKVASYPYIQVKHKYCGNIYEVQSGQFLNVGKRCGNCCQKYENSFAYHIEIELGLKLEDVWDFEKNTVNPYHIWKSGSQKVWVKCRNTEVNCLNGLIKKEYHPSSLVYCNNFTKGNQCPYCASIHGYIHSYDSFGYHNFDKVQSWHPENDISPFRVGFGSHKKYKFICTECNHEWYSLIGNTNKGRWCPQCNRSKGEKKVRAWLNYNNIEYVHDEPYFDDLLSDLLVPLRPDFILPNEKIWIEYDGEFHYKDAYRDGSYEKQIYHDKLKNKYAKKYGWKLIRIKYTEFDLIEDILNKLYYTRINFND